MELYIVRHGQTDWNKSWRLQGRADTELNEKGIQDAKRLREKIRDIPFTKIYTSPLKRARDTAALAAGNRDIPIVDEERIIEISFGAYEGMVLRRDYCEVSDTEFRNFFDAPHLYKAPRDGESLEELIQRVDEFLKELESRGDPEGIYLAATHGTAMSALLTVIEERSLEHFWGSGVPKNCELVHVKIDREGYRIV